CTIIRRAPALPDNRRSYRLPCYPVPDDGGLALIGNPDGHDVRGLDARPQNHAPRRLELRSPDLERVLLHPARLRVPASEVHRFHGDSAALLVVERRARAGGAFVERKG